MQRVPQLARRHALRALAALTFEDMHDLVDPLDAALGILRLFFFFCILLAQLRIAGADKFSVFGARSCLACRIF